MAALMAPSVREFAHEPLKHPLFALLCGLRSFLLVYKRLDSINPSRKSQPQHRDSKKRLELYR